MNEYGFARQSLLALSLALILACGLAQAQPAKEYEPSVGQEGKDVVWVPTPQALVDKMLDMAKVTPKDYVIDLGSGDGRTVITAAKRGAKAHGIEYNPGMVELSKRNAAKEGVSDKSHFRQGGPLRKRLFPSHCDYVVSAAEHQHQVAPDDSRAQARHAHRVELLRHGGMETRRDGHGSRLRKLVHGSSLDRAGKSRRHLETAAGRANAQTNFPDRLRNYQVRQRHHAGQRQVKR
jgi:SAM-dependent methyltransferase